MRYFLTTVLVAVFQMTMMIPSVISSNQIDFSELQEQRIKPITLPEGRLDPGNQRLTGTSRTIVSEDPQRDLAMRRDGDPTGFMAKFHACSATDKSQVLLEACLDYHDGFGDYCGIFTVEHEQWVDFHHNQIILRMMSDFCDICEEECRLWFSRKPQA
jgi:hypothetical protein